MGLTSPSDTFTMDVSTTLAFASYVHDRVPAGIDFETVVDGLTDALLRQQLLMGKSSFMLQFILLRLQYLTTPPKACMVHGLSINLVPLKSKMYSQTTTEIPMM